MLLETFKTDVVTVWYEKIGFTTVTPISLKTFSHERTASWGIKKYASRDAGEY